MSPRNIILRSVIVLAVLAVSLRSAAAVRANEKVYARAVKSTVLISTPKSLGAGALIDANERLVVTANHVVAKDKDVTVFFAAVDAEGRVVTSFKHYLDNSTKLGIKGTVIARLERCDLALIQLSSLPDGAAVMPLAARSASPGQAIHIIGHSSIKRGAVFNYSGDGTVRNILDLKLTITVVNQEGQPKELFEGKVVESSLVVREGDSGGPVVNNAGELVGVVRGTVGALTKEKEFSDSPVNINPDVTEVKELLKTAGFTVPGAPPVVKAKPKPDAQEEATPPASKGTTIAGGVWKFPFADSKGAKFTFEYQFAADGTYRVSKLDENGSNVASGQGQYEVTDNKLTFKKDGKVRVQYLIQFVDANHLSARRDGGEPVTWQR